MYRYGSIGPNHPDFDDKLCAMAPFLSRHSLVLIGLFIPIDLWGKFGNAYVTVWWVDIVTHLLFGAWLAAILLHPQLRHYAKSPLFIFALVLLAGLGWELFELLYDVFVAVPRGITLAQHGAWDTLKDLLNNLLGAAAALWVLTKSPVYFKKF